MAVSKRGKKRSFSGGFAGIAEAGDGAEAQSCVRGTLRARANRSTTSTAIKPFAFSISRSRRSLIPTSCANSFCVALRSRLERKRFTSAPSTSSLSTLPASLTFTGIGQRRGIRAAPNRRVIGADAAPPQFSQHRPALAPSAANARASPASSVRQHTTRPLAHWSSSSHAGGRLQGASLRSRYPRPLASALFPACSPRPHRGRAPRRFSPELTGEQERHPCSASLLRAASARSKN